MKKSNGLAMIYIEGVIRSLTRLMVSLAHDNIEDTDVTIQVCIEDLKNVKRVVKERGGDN